MSAHQRYLEKPYDDAAVEAFLDENAREHGYESIEEWEEVLRDEAADRAFEAKRERELFGEDW